MGCNMDTTQFEYFKIIAETESLTKAAQQLHVSQPAMSAMLKKFEQELNAKLFDRTPNRIKLNATGKAALVHIDSILRDIEKMKADILSLSQKSLSLSIAFCDPGVRWFCVPRFSLAHTEVEIKDELYEQPTIADRLLERAFDITVTPQKIKHAKIQSVPFIDDHVFLSVPLNSKLANRKSIYLEEIPAQALLIPAIGGYFISEMERILAEKNPKVTVVKNEYNITQHLIRTTNFLASISTLSWDLRNDGTHRTRIPVNNPELNVTYYISFLKSNREKTKVFLTWANEMRNSRQTAP